MPTAPSGVVHAKGISTLHTRKSSLGKFSHLPHQDSNPGVLILPLEAPIVEDCSRFTLCISGRDGHAVYILQRHIVGGELKRSKVRVPGVVSVTSSDLCAHSGTFSVVSGSSLAQ